jgi:hypothetical protein
MLKPNRTADQFIWSNYNYYKIITIIIRKKGSTQNIILFSSKTKDLSYLNQIIAKSLSSGLLGDHSEKYSHLFNDIKGKLKPLFLEHWNQVQEKNWKMFMAIAERNENCHL